jgi:crotonobetainyl-CoA:carnitine CoA-transferase CaiB-like acyl-CoA transferase
MASAMSGMVNQTSAYAAGGVVPFRMGNSHPSLFPYEPLPTGDGDLIVTAGNDTQFRRLCTAIGAPELADDPRFANNPGRTANRDILKPLLADKLAAKSAGEWFDQLIAVGVPCGPINTVDKGIEFAEKIGLEPIVTAGTGDKTRPAMRHPVTFSKTPASYPLAPPELDEHGDDIRAWLSSPGGTTPRTPRGASDEEPITSDTHSSPGGTTPRTPRGASDEEPITSDTHSSAES